MKCEVIEDYSSNLEGKIDRWLAKKPGIKITHIAQCSNPDREPNSMTRVASSSMIVVTILYEDK